MFARKDFNRSAPKFHRFTAPHIEWQQAIREEHGNISPSWRRTGRQVTEIPTGRWKIEPGWFKGLRWAVKSQNQERYYPVPGRILYVMVSRVRRTRDGLFAYDIKWHFSTPFSTIHRIKLCVNFQVDWSHRPLRCNMQRLYSRAGERHVFCSLGLSTLHAGHLEEKQKTREFTPCCWVNGAIGRKSTRGNKKLVAPTDEQAKTHKRARGQTHTHARVCNWWNNNNKKKTSPLISHRS